MPANKDYVKRRLLRRRNFEMFAAFFTKLPPRPAVRHLLPAQAGRESPQDAAAPSHPRLGALKRGLAVAILAAGGTGLAIPASAQALNPGAVEGYVAAYGEVSFFEVFEGGGTATIELSGDCASDIDLWVHDSNGHKIASSTSYSCEEAVSFTPAWRDTFRIRVENTGHPRGSNFILVTY